MRCVLWLVFGPLLLVFLTGCGSRGERLIVLQTGRMCGNVYPAELRGISPLQHYPYLAGYVRQVRAEAAASGARVLLVDSGDSLGGSFASHATDGANVAALFNHLGYDAVFLGNLDANLDPAVFHNLHMPVLVPFANAAGLPPLPGARFAAAVPDGADAKAIVAANFYGDTPPASAPHRFPLWFGDTRQRVSPVRDYAPLLSPLRQRHPGVPVLFHWMKFEAPEAPPAWAATLRGLGVDALLAHRIYNSSTPDTWGTRDYQSWPLPVSENILRQNGGFTVARLDLVRRNGRWTAPGPHRLIQLTADTAPADPSVVAAISPFAEAIRSADLTLASLPRGLSAPQLQQVVVNVLARATGADAVLYSPSSIRSGLDAGTLTANRLFAALPWTAPVAVVEVPAARLKEAALPQGTVLQRRQRLPDTVRVAAPLYFALLLQEHPVLAGATVRTAAPEGEFDLVLQHLTAQPSLLEQPALPEGWTDAQP